MSDGIREGRERVLGSFWWDEIFCCVGRSATDVYISLIRSWTEVMRNDYTTHQEFDMWAHDRSSLGVIPELFLPKLPSPAR